MSPHCTSPAPRFADDDEYAHARDVLARAGYAAENLISKLGNYVGLRLGAMPGWIERTRESTPLNQLIRLFLLGLPVSTSGAQSAVAPMPVESWARAGLLRLEGDQVRALVLLTPHEDLVVATDLCGPLHAEQGADHVISVGPSSVLMGALTIRRPVARALDLGCGAGTQALTLARHARSVWATDCNPRALQFAAFNARLNDIPNVQWVRGDWLAPFAGQQFDLIVAVPPYVISPEAQFVYRDSGEHGDQLCRDLLRQAAAHLVEGGICQMLVQWAHLTGQPWEQRITSWFAGTGCDAWVLKLETQDPMSYAATWVSGDQLAPAELLRQAQAWRAHLEAQGIEAVSSALVTLRRAGGRRNWVVFRDRPDKILRPCAHALLACMDAHDLLESLSEEQLLRSTLQRSPATRLTQELEPAATGWAPAASRLSIRGDWIYSCRTDPRVATLLAQCDGQRTLAQVLEDLAQSTGIATDTLTRASLPIVCELIEFGLLCVTGTPT